MAWKKLALYDEVAAVSNNTPIVVDGSAGSAGTNTGASRDDHEHGIGPLVATLNINQKTMDGMVLEKSLTDVDAASEEEGQIWYNNNTTNQHAFVWVP